MIPSNDSKPKDPAWQINTLAESARQLADRGEHEAAIEIYEKILAIAPHHVRALNYLAVRAMENKDFQRSLALLERAIRAAPQRAVLYQNLGLVHHAMGNNDAALKALDKALELRPVFPSALLHKGAILEVCGLPELALYEYAKAWNQAPEMKTWLSDKTQPMLYKLVVRSWSQIRDTRRQTIDRALAPVRSKFGNSSLERIEECAAIYLEDNPAVYTDPLQRPEFLYVPKLDPIAFYERSAFDWSPDLESKTSAIQQELGSVLQGTELSPYVDMPRDRAPEIWQKLNQSRQWSAYHLIQRGHEVPGHCEKCSVTHSAVSRLPLARLPDHAPDALFSVLSPETHIPPHFGLGNYKLNVHLPLIVPDECSIRVGSETRHWNLNEVMVFDDSFEHEAWNTSKETRVVLIAMIWNPQLTEAERHGMTALISSISSYNVRYGITAII